MNRELLFYITAILLCAGILSCNKKEAIATCNYEVVPLPKSITPAKEAPFILSTSTHIGYPEGNEKLRQTAVFLSGYIREMTGIETEVTADTGSSNSIRLVLDRTAVSSPEGYRLKVGKRDITITGSSEAGIFYGIQTLRKSLPVTGQKEISFPAVQIRLITVYDKSHYTYSEHVFQITENFRTDTLQDALEISLSTIGNRPIYYTTDGSQPDTASLIYTEPLIIREDTKLKAVIVTTEDTSSVFEEHIHVNKATFKPSWLANAPHENYTFNGVSTLTDGLQGNQNYNTGRWLGFLKDMDLTIDLQKSTPVSSVSLTVNVSKGAAVMDATGLEVWCSEDGKEYRKLASASYPVLDKEDKDGIYPHTLSFSVVETRYVRIIARVTPKLPAWHMWPGNPAFLFVDEVCVK